MKDQVTIITPELQPGGGGLADYALRVVEEWRDRAEVHFLLPNETRWRERLPRDRGKILLHYSAYGFDRVGYPRDLLRALLDWQRAGSGTLAVMFHEIWTFWPVWNKNYLVQRLHRSDIRKMVAQADAVFTSTPSQAGHLLGLVPTSAVRVLPVGSNIRALPSTAVRESGLAILFGLQNSRLRTLRQLKSDLSAFAQAKVIEKIIAVGQSNGAEEEEQALLAGLGLARDFEQPGALPEDEISKLLSRASFGISSQGELSLHKSGTFMAYAAHGLNIISPSADALAPEPVCWLTHPRDLLRGIAAHELEARAESLRHWQEHTSSWPWIAEQFADALKLPHAS